MNRSLVYRGAFLANSIACGLFTGFARAEGKPWFCGVAAYFALWAVYYAIQSALENRKS